ncbi:hypothetical protein N0B44_18870 [Roseibacterium beibuensis]|uniref:hypothetical protein n=1 Tax=[Roseibacterium] beibuensis TaxID=1193142 RepID=UPI00217EAE16|nr:hypothetical protein [Roseibacterium beibuensis]MCS6624981.1 hypothetical protein [Roseibacterium beibuensis]
MSLVAIAAAALLQSPPVSEIAVGDLLGRSRAEVAGLLGAREPSPSAALTRVEGDRIVEVFTGASLYPDWPAGQTCITRLFAPGEEGLQPLIAAVFPPPHRAQVHAWIFEGDHLAAIRVARPRPSPPPTATPGELKAWAIQQGARNGWMAEPGRLPLASDLPTASDEGFAAETDRIVTACRPRSQSSGPRPFDDAGLVQGLALLPFAVALPGLNAERDRAAREGPALMARLALGEPVPGGASAFVAGLRGVRLYRDPEDLDYGVIVISLGWDERNNLSRYNDVGMVGVRGDRVVWKAGPGAAEALGLRQAMCVDAAGRVGQARPGCSNTGQFTFGD